MRGDEDTMLAAAKPLIDAGIAVHWLRRQSKAPAEDGWQAAPIHTFESLKAAYRRGYNLGVRPGEFSLTGAGYLHLLDLDIRNAAMAEEVWKIVLAMWPDARKAPFVISGSGGESRHLYFFTDKPFRSKTLAHSTGFSLVFDAKKERDVKKYDWEIALFGAPKQAVLPPSIHPDTGNPYVWGREIDFDLLDFGVGPLIPSADVESWGVSLDDMNLEDDDDGLAMAVRMSPMGLSETEITETLRDLPAEWLDDRDQWNQVGMALHHEYEGKAAGFERWSEWSKQSDKYDAKDQAVVWKSYKGRRNPVRMATLIKAARDERLRIEHVDLDAMFEEYDELDELLNANRTSTSLTVQVFDHEEDELDLLLRAGSGPGGSVGSGPGGSIAQPKDGLGEFDPEWISNLQLTDEGIKSCLHNVELIVRHDKRFRGVAAFNDFTQEIVQIAEPKKYKLQKASPKPIRQLDGPVWRMSADDKVNGKLWSDSHDIAMRLIFETPQRQGGYSLKTTDRDLMGAINKVAQLNHFHPVRNYLTDLEWDGTHRMERLFVDYVGAPDDAYHREAAKLFMLGAVTRVFEPGHKFDFVPILEGLQGKRKSTFIRILARNWFCEIEGDFHDTKGMVEKMQGCWIGEIPELQGFSKAEVTTIKGWISRQVDKCRLAYAKRAGEFRRQCVFVGSTNEEEYLRDQTGGRRFWPIACTVEEIDTDKLEREIDQMWAEAYTMYKVWRELSPYGTLPLYMKNPVAREEAKRLQETRRQEQVEDALSSQIEVWLDTAINDAFDDDDVPRQYRNEICLLEIWEDMMGRDKFTYHDKPREQQALARAMRKLEGWSPAGQGRLKKYGKQRVFKRIEPK